MLAFSGAAHTLHHWPWNPQGAAPAAKHCLHWGWQAQASPQDAGRALERNTFPLPFLSWAGSNWLWSPSSTLPPLCQHSSFGQQDEGWSQVSTSGVPLAPKRSSRLGRRLPRAWHPARGAGSTGQARVGNSCCLLPCSHVPAGHAPASNGSS